MSPPNKSWSRDWGQITNTGLQCLTAYKRQINGDINARIRLFHDAQRIGPNVAPHIEQIIRAPLTGLR